MKKISKVIWISACLFLGFKMCFAQGSGEKSVKDRYYQVVMIWVKDPQKFQEYSEKMAPIVTKYGGAGERIITPVSTFYGGSTGESLDQPHMVNIVYYDSKEAYERFVNDPDFKKIVHLRDQSIEMVGIGGTAVGGELKGGDASKRLYMLEFAYFKDGNGDNYKKYTKASKGFNKRFDMNSERILQPDDVFGDIEMPDRVTIKYLGDGSKRAAMESDVDHEKVERLYGEAIRDLVWVEGKAAYINMN